MAERVAEQLVNENDTETFLRAERMARQLASVEVEEILIPAGDFQEVLSPEDLIGVSAVAAVPEVWVVVRLALEGSQGGVDFRGGRIPVHETCGELVVGVA
jgi:hypothetical protein